MSAFWSVRPARLVVVAPHPDDEVLGTGGLLRLAERWGVPTVVVAVTDGEASHADSTWATPRGLRTVRHAERARALAVLGVAPALERLGLPDGAVDRHEADLAALLAERTGPDDLVLAPWRHDGHPDHDATGRAAAVATEAVGATLGEVEIWAKVRPPGGIEGAGRRCRVELDAATRAAKRAAARCYTSQLVALGPAPEDGPVVHAHEVAALLDGPEIVRWR